MTRKKDTLDDAEKNQLREAYETLSAKVKCFICHDKIKKVVCIECGHHFCRPCISKHLSKVAKCPRCELDVAKDVLITNKALTLLFEHLQQIVAQCEKNLPDEMLKELKAKQDEPKQKAPSTPRRSSSRTSLAAPKSAEKRTDNQVPTTSKSAASSSTKLFDNANKKITQNEQTKQSDLPTRIPSQFPEESSAMTEFSVDPQHKVSEWLDRSVPGNVPTQERPINTPLLTQFSMVSASQTGPLKSTTVQVPATQSKEESQAADSLIFLARPKRKSSIMNKTIESEIIMENGPELFQSQSSEYQNKKEEKRLKKIETLNTSVEKKGARGLGLRRRKPTPTPVVLEEERAPEPVELPDDEPDESDEIRPRKKKSAPISSDEESEIEIIKAPVLNTTIQDFLVAGDKTKPSRQYGNRKSNQKDDLAVTPPRGQTTTAGPEKRASRLSLRAIPKTPTITEVISPVSSPTTTAAAERNEESRTSTNANAFSRFKKMKSDFKEKKKIVPLNVSTTSIHQLTPADKGKKQTSPSYSKEMVIESASEQKSTESPVKRLRVDTTDPSEDQGVQAPPEKEAEKSPDEVAQTQTQCSLNLIESSLPIESSPLMPLQRVVQQNQTTPTTSSPSVISNSPLTSPAPVNPLKAVISPSTIRLLEKIDSKSSTSSAASRKRKTFSLESNTNEIACAAEVFSPPSAAPAAKQTKSAPAPRLKTITFFKRGKLSVTKKNYKVNFIKLGYLSPKLVSMHIQMRKRIFKDSSAQTEAPWAPCTHGAPTWPEVTRANQSALCQTSFDNSLMDTTVMCQNQSTPAPEVLEDDDADEEVIEKSQDSIQEHVFQAPPKKQKTIIPGTCTLDSDEIIPASMPTVTQPPSRAMVQESSSLSLTLPIESFDELDKSLNESDYNVDVEPERSVKRRKVARRLSQIEKGDSDEESKRPAASNKKQRTEEAAIVRSQGPWSYSSQDSVVQAAVLDARMAQAELISKKKDDQVPVSPVPSKDSSQKSILQSANKSMQENSTVKGSHVSPFLEDSDTLIEAGPDDSPEKICSPPMPVDDGEKENAPMDTSVFIESEKTICEESDDEMIEGTPKAKPVFSIPKVPALPPRVNMIFSSLSKPQISEIHLLTKTLKNCEVSTSMNPNVTHLVVPQSDDMCTISTLKFYLAVAKGLWVVSSQWVTDCLIAGKIIPEEPYEMKNTHDLEGPRLSRLGKGGLFKDFEFLCLKGDYSGMTRGQLKEIVHYGGGLVLESLEDKQVQNHRVIIYGTDDVPEGYLDKGCIVLMVDWLLESIENYKLANAFSYLPSEVSMTQVSEAHYNLPSEMMHMETIDSTD